MNETNPSVLCAVHNVVFEDRVVPALKDPWDVRVRIAQTGICGSDVHYWQRGRIAELGTVVEVGSAVKPVAVAVQITKVGKVKPNQTVVVFGCGPIGILCQAVSKVYAAQKVIGVDISASRAEFARKFGADNVFVPPTKSERIEDSAWSENVAHMMKEQFGLGEGPDVVLEATGAQRCIQTGVHLTKKGGMYVQAGMGRENVVFPITTACIRDLTIRGSIRYTTGCYPAAVDLISSGKIDVKWLVTDRYKFEQAGEAFELVRQGKESVIKVIIEGVSS